MDMGQGGIRPPPDYLSNLMRQQAGGLPGAAAAAQQLAGHDALQRQLMFERERGLLGAAQQAQQAQQAAANQQGLAASQHLQQLQMEEYHRWDSFMSGTLMLKFKIQGCSRQGDQSENTGRGCQAGGPEIENLD